MLLIDSAIARTGVFARAHYLVSVSRARARGPAASGFDPGAPASSYGVASARADRNRWPRGVALTDSPSVFSRARGAAAALPSGPGRGRAAPPFFSFSVFRRRLQLRGRPRRAPPSRARGYTALTISPPFLVRARGRPRGQRFRSGGAGIELWGSFGARRSKPLAAGWVYGVCSLWIFRLESPARGLRLYPLAKVAAEAGGRRRWSSVIPIPPRRDKVFVGCDPT